MSKTTYLGKSSQKGTPRRGKYGQVLFFFFELLGPSNYPENWLPQNDGNTWPPEFSCLKLPTLRVQVHEKKKTIFGLA